MNDEKLDLILKEIQDVKQDLQTVKQDQQDMKSQMNSRFDTIEAILAVHGEKFIVIEKKLDGVQEQAANNAENIDVVKKVQIQQERTIELLSRRSLDQEAEIKSIKM